MSRETPSYLISSIMASKSSMKSSIRNCDPAFKLFIDRNVQNLSSTHFSEESEKIDL